MTTNLVARPPGSLGGFHGPEQARQVQRSRTLRPFHGPEWTRVFTKRSVKLMVRTLQKNIRVTPGQWNRIEKEAVEREISAEPTRGRACDGGPRPRGVAPHGA